MTILESNGYLNITWHFIGGSRYCHWHNHTFNKKRLFWKIKNITSQLGGGGSVSVKSNYTRGRGGGQKRSLVIWMASKYTQEIKYIVTCRWRGVVLVWEEEEGIDVWVIGICCAHEVPSNKNFILKFILLLNINLMIWNLTGDLHNQTGRKLHFYGKREIRTHDHYNVTLVC